jgi:hypothetical protein
MPITNLLIIVFILAMAYWWSIQGFFSAFVHLGLVIVCGTLAYALWEPIAFALMGYFPMVAWGVGLIVPFAVLLIVTRLAADRLVGGNVHFHKLVGNLGGAACGVATGVLTSGLVVIGLGFLPLPSDMGGYEPYAIGGDGGIMETDRTLWVPVDYGADRFFGTLASGAFASSTPLGEYQPNLPYQAALFRLRSDAKASVVAHPKGVSVKDVLVHSVPVAGLTPAMAQSLGEAFKNEANRLILVGTEFSKTGGTFDPDGALRIAPAQIRLTTQRKSADGVELAMNAPVGYVLEDVVTGENWFRPFNSATSDARAAGQTIRMSWVFILPADLSPQFLLVRHLRLGLPEADQFKTGEEETLAALGELWVAEQPRTQTAAAAAVEEGPSELGAPVGINAGHYAEEIEQTTDLPKALSKNYASGLEVQEGLIMSGMATASQPPGMLSKNTRIDGVWVPSHEGMIRLTLTPERAQSLLGAARTAAASLNGVWLNPEKGDPLFPLGYVWLKTSGEQRVRVDRNDPIRSARQLPITEMQPGDKLYLYFAVTKRTRIVSYSIGDAMTQEITPPLVVGP